MDLIIDPSATDLDGICVQATVPSFVPTDMLTTGLNLMWNSELGKQLETQLAGALGPDGAARIDAFQADAAIDESACRQDTDMKQLMSYEKEIPFIGNLSFKVYSDMDMASITGLQQKIAEKGEKELAEEFIQTCWGIDSIKKAAAAAVKSVIGTPKSKTVSLDMDATMSGKAAGSVCFEASIPDWIPTAQLASGIQSILNSGIMTTLNAKLPGITIAADAENSSTPVQAGVCDRAENPDELASKTYELPFVNTISGSVYGSTNLKAAIETFG